jgi:hypothetical protein
LPALLISALEQAGYKPDAIPCVVLSATGGTALVVLPLRAFVTIVGVSHEND